MAETYTGVRIIQTRNAVHPRVNEDLAVIRQELPGPTSSMSPCWSCSTNMSNAARTRSTTVFRSRLPTLPGERRRTGTTSRAKAAHSLMATSLWMLSKMAFA